MTNQMKNESYATRLERGFAGAPTLITSHEMLEYGDARAAHARKQALEDAEKLLDEDSRCRIAGAPQKIRSMK